jgi:tetratricopeptide (TPR) repeat protein
MKTTLLITLLALSAGAQNRLEETLRKGILEEESKQNLNGAIQAYQSVLTQFDDERKTAATALFRMAESYRKLGKNAEAIAAYNRVVKEFSDQTKLAEQSRAHLTNTYKVRQEDPSGTINTLREIDLARLQTLAVDSARAATEMQARIRYRKLKQEEIKLMEDQLGQIQKQVDLGLVDPNSQAVFNVKAAILKLKQELVAFEAGIASPRE